MSRALSIRKMAAKKELPQIILFGDSLTEWSFDESTEGFGWVLRNKYAGKAEIVNEGMMHCYGIQPPRTEFMRK